MKRKRKMDTTLKEIQSVILFGHGILDAEFSESVLKCNVQHVDRVLLMIQVAQNGIEVAQNGIENEDYGFEIQLGEEDGGIPKLENSLLLIQKTEKEMEQEKHDIKKQRKNKKKKLLKNKNEEERKLLETEIHLMDKSRVELLYQEETSVYVPNVKAYRNTVMVGDGRCGKILALDCEMCKSSRGAELTRVSIVDEKLDIVFDSFVVPEVPILDYCTEYSGVTAKDLENCDMTLEKVQDRILTFVFAETILAGHSIENDLQALRIRHERILDTSELFPHFRGPPYKMALRHLVKVFLKREIQNDVGHCSAEDAVATMELVQLKIKHGPTFPKYACVAPQTSLLVKLGQESKRCTVIDAPGACRSICGGAANVIASASNAIRLKHLTSTLSKVQNAAQFVWARFDDDSEDLIRLRQKTIETLLPTLNGTTMMIHLEVPSLQQVQELHRIRCVRRDGDRSLNWTAADAAKLKEAMQVVLKGRCNIIVHSA